MFTRLSHDSDSPARPGFKEALKQRILDARHTQRMPFFAWFQRIPPKLAAGGTVSLVVVIILMLVLNPFSSSIPVVYAQNNFTLSAEREDTLGIDPTTGFILESREPLDMDFIREYLKTDLEVPFQIEKVDDFHARVTFKDKLSSGQMVRFLLPTEVATTAGATEARPYAWAFQVKSSFQVLNTIPGDKTAEVPLDAGIEVVFSHENVDVEDFKRAFSIEPNVTGHVEKNRRSMVFVPDTLEPATLYTVTIHKNLHPSGSDQTLGEDYVYKFETSEDLSRRSTISFQQQIVTATPTENVQFQLAFENYYSDNTPVGLTQFTMYQFSSFEQFKTSYQSSLVDSWRKIKPIRSFVPIDQLRSVASFTPTALNQSYFPMYEVPFTLDEGYYGVLATYEGHEVWLFLQSSFISATLIHVEEGESLVWVHNTKTAKPLAGVRFAGIDSVTTDQSGIAKITLPDNTQWLEVQNEHRKLLLPSVSGNSSVDGEWWRWNRGPLVHHDYVGYLYTDRPVYKAGDAVSVWGFLQHRDAQPLPSALTLRIVRDTYGYFEGVSRPGEVEYVRVPIEPSREGIFTTHIKLPPVGSGQYSVKISHGDEQLVTRTIQVQEYRKPVYYMNFEVKEPAAIDGETVHYDVSMKFFDDTPVQGKTVTIQSPGDTQTVTLDSSGRATGAIKVTTAYGNYASVTASIDEAGFEPIAVTDNLEMYFSSISLQTEATLKNGTSTLFIDSRTVHVTDSNDREEHLKTIRPGTQVDIQVIESSYEKISEGKRYDFIRKTVSEQYRYEHHERQVDSQTVLTNAQGKATLTFRTPNKDSHYRFELRSVDEKGRTFTSTVYAYENNDSVYDSAYSFDESLQLVLTDRDQSGMEKVMYKLGERVSLDVHQYGKKFEMIPGGSFLFVQAQRGVKEYAITQTPNYTFPFEARDIPNLYIFGVFFTGNGYVILGHSGYSTSGKYIGFDSTTRKLKVTVETNAEEYKPGAEAEVRVRVQDAQGKPVAANVNISVVDEAFFAVFPDSADPIGSLYVSLPSGVRDIISSHERKAEALGAEGGGGGDGEIRSNFLDTAAFVTLSTNQNGEGTTHIKLPDPITSWRLTTHAIDGNRIQGGVSTKKISTTLPFFINAAIQPTYLLEDEPEIIVAAQGKNLQLSDQVSYEISVKGTDIGSSVQSTIGQRAHLPLPRLPEGEQTIVIKASTLGNLKDGIEQKVQVVSSRLTEPVVNSFALAESKKLKGADDGLTSVTFVDGNKGKYYQDLRWMSWRYGDRADEATVRAIATELINNTFGMQEYVPEIDASTYQQGGIRLLSHADVDPILTAKIALFEDTPFDEVGLQMYLLSRLYDKDDKQGMLSPEEAAWAYAGLVALDTPVFAELKRFEQQPLSDEAKLAVAIAYLFAGDAEGARALYQEFMKDAKRELGYVWVERETPEESMEVNAALYVLASGLNETQDRDGLNDHLDRFSSGETLVILEELLAVKQGMAFAKPGASKLSYTLRGETKKIELELGDTATIAVSPDELKTLDAQVISGDVLAMTSYQQPVSTLSKTYGKIGVQRRYVGDFKEGSVVLVELTYQLNPSLPKEFYEITDSVPSGLTPVTYRGGYETDQTCVTFPETDTDQTLTFFVYSGWNSMNCPPNTIRYYARVMNTGTFKAEPAAIRSMRNPTLVNYSDAQTVTITP